MRSSWRRLGAVLALTVLVLATRPAPAHSQGDPEFRLFSCAVTCLYHALNGQCTGRSNEQCVAWYSGCVEGCMFAI